MIRLCFFVLLFSVFANAKEKEVNYLTDPENRIHEFFAIPEYFEHNVNFWFAIYTKHSYYEVLLHDSERLDLVYNVVDFNSIYNSNLNKYAKENLKKKLEREKINEVKKIFKTLETKNFKKLNHREFQLVETIRKAGFKIPVSQSKRKKLFKGLASNIRSQSGQKDKIFKGIASSREYIHQMHRFRELFKLPEEVLTIPFLESSFNLKAHSKASAVGIWQFMEYTNNLVMPRKTSAIDYRKNPIISTLAALQLLKENKLILRTWDLAISAYNAGTRELVRARQKYRKRKGLDLAYILQHYNHDSLGFAVKNFYSEFLALTHALAYKENLYPVQEIKTVKKEKQIDIYVSKCRIRPATFFSKIKSSAYDIQELNAHFLKPKKTYSRGSLIVSDVELTSRKYFKISDKDLVKLHPKKFYQLIRNKKCGS
ncbi:MAG: hypothetical protein CME62_17095 [Halobacteriovoraceae bacterium]|nr:hypothetical protein [Halobacteriovoraceae bacterium]|tara:strand:- start:5710 stop:6990 length:1281 start_codon:yes stop_codon:yes gene_type:complete